MTIEQPGPAGGDVPEKALERLRGVLGDDPTVIAERLSQATGQSAAHIISSLSYAFTGPYPPPEMLAAYDKVLPGLADRLVRQAETQTAHRQELERRLLEAEVDDRSAERSQRRLGLWLAYSVVLAVLIAAVIIAAIGAPIEGTVLGGVDLVALAGVFVYGSRQTDPQRTTSG